MMKNSGKKNNTGDSVYRRRTLRKWLAGFLAASTAFSMLSGSAAVLMADELATEYALAGAGSGQDVTVHFGNDKDKDINIHVNPETGVQESETLAGLGAETEYAEETEAETEAETEEAKKVYFYEDSKVSVTATLEKPGAVPADAEFRVTEITANSKDYNYGAYIDALNNMAESTSEQPEDRTDSENNLRVSGNGYDETNTLLYDVAFIMHSYDEGGNVIEGTEYEYQPEEGAVDIRIEFKKSQLTDELGILNEKDVTITHLPLSDTVRNTVDSTADATEISARDISVESVKTESISLQDGGIDQADFQLKSFSVIAVTGLTEESVSARDYPSMRIEDVVNRSIYYGVTANEWHFTQGTDSETSLAVGKLFNDGAQNGSNDSKSKGAECQYILIGEIVNGNGNSFFKLKGYEAYIRSPYARESGMIKYGEDNPETDSRLHFSVENMQDLKNEVSQMVADAGRVSNEFKLKDSLTEEAYNSLPAIGNGNKVIIDLTDLPDNKTYFINVEKWSALFDAFKQSSGVTIKKHSGQKIVFNFPSTTTIDEAHPIEKYTVIDDGVSYDSTFLADQTSANIDVLEDIIFNFPNAQKVFTHDVAGVILAPNGEVHVTGVGGGWVISDKFYNYCEWHFTYHKVYEEGCTTKLQARKRVNGEFADESGFRFRLEMKEGNDWTTIQEVQNNGSWVEFNKIVYDPDTTQGITFPHEFIYRISEPGETTQINGKKYTNDPNVYYARVRVEKQHRGDTIYYIASHPKYYTNEQCDPKSEIATVSGFPEFNNTFGTCITVDKQWFRGNQALLGQDAPVDSIDFNLFRKETLGPENNDAFTSYSMNIDVWNNNSFKYQEQGNYYVNYGETIGVTVIAYCVPTVRAFYGYYPYQDSNKIVPASRSVENGDGTITSTFYYKVPLVPKIPYQDLNTAELQIDFSGNWVDGVRIEVNKSPANPQEISGGSYPKSELQGTYSVLRSEGWRKKINELKIKDRNELGQIVYYSYYVEEINNSGYTAAYQNNDVTEGTIIIKNTLPEVVTIFGQKRWVDADDILEKRPERITVRLYRNGVATDLTQDTDASKNWEYSFAGLPEKDNSGNRYVYSVKEESVPDGYTATEDELNINNTYYSSIQINKEWVNDSDHSITPNVGGSISFILKQVKHHGESTTEVVFNGGELEKRNGQDVPGVSSAINENGEKYYIIEAQENEDGTYTWPTASIKSLPVEGTEEDVTYIYSYYVEELIPEDKQWDVRCTVDGGIPRDRRSEETYGDSLVTIINKEISYVMPATGGEGTRWIYLVSITLVVLAGVGLIIVRRRREMTR